MNMLELSIVVPTFNEKENVKELLARLQRTLIGVNWEVTFVDDDSPDGTAEIIREIACSTPNVRCLQRIGKRGLSEAVIEGILATAAPYVVVMDADLQHDESILPKMLHEAKSRQLDVVIGSRYCNGGSTGGWDKKRATMSRFATAISRLIVTSKLSDPMSGFFLVRREAFMRAVKRLSGEGYKILIDLFASSPRALKFSEIPYTFRERFAGESKLDTAVLWEYLTLIIDKMLGRIIPLRFILFSGVGASGLIVHFSVLWALHRIANIEFSSAQIAATLVAMTSNYTFNNLITYRDCRRTGTKFFTGLATFYLACGIGAVANVSIASYVFKHEYGWLLAGLSGVLVSTVWNYVVTSVFTWRKGR